MKRSSEEALAYFDSLPCVDTSFMLGNWKGSEFETNHPLDGLLTAAGWKGKQFVSEDLVHPLLFKDFSMNPSFIPMSLTLLRLIPRKTVLSQMLNLMRPILSTKESNAKLKMLSYRKRVTCAMVYTDQPIIDYFAKIDDNEVLGVMESKGRLAPYFFKLTRDGG